MPGSPPDLARFEDWLRDGDSAALDWWRQHGTAIGAWLGPALARRVGQALTECEFDVALDAIASARRRNQTHVPGAAATAEPT